MPLGYILNKKATIEHRYILKGATKIYVLGATIVKLKPVLTPNNCITSCTRPEIIIRVHSCYVIVHFNGVFSIVWD